MAWVLFEMSANFISFLSKIKNNIEINTHTHVLIKILNIFCEKNQPYSL